MSIENYIQNPDPWSYPRLSLAQHIGMMCKDTLFSRMAYLGTRRIGKTHFLLHDLSPFLLANNLTPIYINMWGNKNSPQTEFIEQLSEALNELTKEGLVKRLLNADIEKLAIGSQFGKLEMKFAPKPVSDIDMRTIKTLLSDVTKASNNKVVLILDEFQHLSTSPMFEDLLYSLRTLLDTYGTKITVIYTGSSRKGMKAAFQDKDVPFYQSAQVNEFPVIDDGFVEHCVTRLQNAYGIYISKIELLDFWNETGRSPYWTINLMRELVSKQCSLSQATNFIKDAIAIENNLDEIIGGLSKTEMAVLLLLNNKYGLYSQKSMNFIANMGGNATKSYAQSAKESLDNKNIISILPNKDIIVEIYGLIDRVKKELNVADVTEKMNNEE